jgi:AcrR family transcriptional regulator
MRTDQSVLQYLRLPTPVNLAQGQNLRTKTLSQEVKMLNAAAKLFGTQRFHEVRMEDIASKAVVGKGTLYRYFRDKEELYSALVKRSGEQLIERLREAMAPAQRPREKLEAVTAAIIVFFDEQPHLSDLIQRSEVLHRAGAAFSWQATREELVRLVRDIFDEAKALGDFKVRDPESMALMLLGGLRSVIRFGRQPRQPDIGKRIVTAFLSGAIHPPRQRRLSRDRNGAG